MNVSGGHYLRNLQYPRNKVTTDNNTYGGNRPAVNGTCGCKIIRIGETDSTNRFLREYKGEEGSLMTVAAADYQTAGRGQGSNTWESEAGKNLLFSILTHPERLGAQRQFVMLEAGSLAVRDALSPYADGFSVKWPNDVYWHDMKISGTLSECTISHGFVSRCIMGTGININQRTFVSDAPNPVSLAQITGHDVSREIVMESVIGRLGHYLGMITEDRYDEIHALYHEALYRREGLHAYRDTTDCFMAAIRGIEPDGRLVLRRADGSERTYMFKEVEFINSDNK